MNLSIDDRKSIFLSMMIYGGFSTITNYILSMNFSESEFSSLVLFLSVSAAFVGIVGFGADNYISAMPEESQKSIEISIRLLSFKVFLFLFIVWTLYNFVNTPKLGIVTYLIPIFAYLRQQYSYEIYKLSLTKNYRIHFLTNTISAAAIFVITLSLLKINLIFEYRILSIMSVELLVLMLFIYKNRGQLSICVDYRDLARFAIPVVASFPFVWIVNEYDKLYISTAFVNFDQSLARYGFYYLLINGVILLSNAYFSSNLGTYRMSLLCTHQPSNLVHKMLARQFTVSGGIVVLIAIVAYNASQFVLPAFVKSNEPELITILFLFLPKYCYQVISHTLDILRLTFAKLMINISSALVFIIYLNFIPIQHTLITVAIGCAMSYSINVITALIVINQKSGKHAA